MHIEPTNASDQQALRHLFRSHAGNGLYVLRLLNGLSARRFEELAGNYPFNVARARCSMAKRDRPELSPRQALLKLIAHAAWEFDYSEEEDCEEFATRLLPLVLDGLRRERIAKRKEIARKRRDRIARRNHIGPRNGFLAIFEAVCLSIKLPRAQH